MTDESESQQLDSGVIEFLQRGGEKAAALGHLSMAGQIEHSIHTLHLTRNRLDKKDNHETKVMFLNGAIKILEKELERNLKSAHAHWLVSRGQYEKETLDADSKGP